LVLAALGVGSVLWLAAAGPTTSESQTYEQSFKGGTECPSDFKLFGPGAEEHLRFQPDGLRITLPPGSQGGGAATGVRSLFGVRGNFEITVSFDILAESPPAGPHSHPRFTLEIPLDRPEASAASLSRRTTAKGGVDFLPWVRLWNETTQRNEEWSKPFSTTARSGRLRLVRSGSTLSYYASEGKDGDFTLLQTHDFGDEDVKEVVLAAATEDAQAALDVHVSDLRIRARPVPNLPRSSAPPPGKGRSWLAAAAIIGLLTALALPGGWLLARRNRRARKAPVPNTAVKPAAAVPLVALACPSCGHALRVKAGVEGKDVKCPHCGHAVSVPGPGAAVSRRAPNKSGLLVGLAALPLLAALALPVLFFRLAPRPGQPTGGGAQGPSFLNVTLGGEAVPGVDDSGFSYQEYENGRPFRWTDGNGRLVIPIDRANSPQALLVQLVTYRGPGVNSASLEIRVNEHPVFHDQIPLGRWEKTFDLKGIDLGERLVLDLVSDTFSPLGNRKGNGQVSDDPRTLGAKVRAVKLLGGAEWSRGAAAPDRTMTLRPDQRPGLCCGALTADGKTLVTGCWDGTVTLWDVAANQERKSFVRLVPDLQALAVGPDGTTFATADRERVVGAWDAETGQPRAELRGHTGDLTALAYAPDGKTLASAGGNRFQTGELKLWDVAARTERVPVEPFPRRLWGLAYAPDGKSVAVAAGDGTAQVVDTGTGKVQATFNHPSYAHGVAFSPDGKRLAVGYGDEGDVRIYDVDSGTPWASFQAPQHTYAGRLEFAPDGKRLLAPCLDGTALVWDLANPQAPAVTALGGHGGPVRFAVFFPDGRTVATGDDRTIQVWRLGGTPPAPASPAPPPARTDRRGWWAAGGGLALALGASLGAWLYVRRRRAGSRPASVLAEEKNAKPGAAPAAVSFPCAACGKNLKVRAALAGKKVKCPRCGRAAHVPGTRADESIRPAP
jgi:WD40 repeat protein/predicted RNA-binding Zn-ribbon protein involved in translation (DUF1610 family)